MNFSIIIVNYNTKELLRNCLQSILKHCQLVDFEIIVVDNASKDGSLEMINKEFANKVQSIGNNRNKGFGSANNQAAKIAKNKYLFFLNSDTIITSDILTPLAKFLDEQKSIGIISPRLLLKNGQEQLYGYGRFPTVFNSVFKQYNKIKDKLGPWFEVDWASGAALIIRRSLFEQLNGFDEKYFMYFEDVDLCKRAVNSNFKIAIYHDLSLIHLGGKSLDKFSKRKKYYYQSQDYFYSKHYGFISTLLMKIIRLPYRIINLLIK